MKAKGQNRGHCQACGRIHVVLPGGLVAKHGYTVRSGYFSGVCGGAAWLPLELQRSRLDWIVKDLKRHAKMHDKHAAQLKSGESVPSQALKRDSWNDVVYGPCIYGTYERAPVLVSWSEASPVERQKQIDLDIGTSVSEASFARSHAKSLLKLAERVHGQPLIDRDAEELARVAERKAKSAPIPGAFRTKAAQKAALESLNRHFSKIRTVIKDTYLALPERVPSYDNPGFKMYDTMPFDLHNWRTKHGALVIAAFPSLEPQVREIERLYAERSEIKATPVIK